ncbi:hypothetical protein BJX61DRAFT_316731 [Aspergillus egyptiacus]|nr:hypothetical protein BJX61DRAFT_316731 [Aspergillus egyptiacus]
MTAPREEPRLQPDMEDPTDLAAPFELEIKDLGDRRREYTYKTDPYQGTRSRVTTIWKRKSYFAHKDGEIYPNVYLDESGDGRLRVVKEIVPRKIDGGNRYSELETMFRVINTVGPDYSRLFVEFLGWFESSCGLSLVLEYCALGDIDQCFAEPVPEQVAKTVAGQLLEGIAALHILGITHRDIKPEVYYLHQSARWIGGRLE